MTYPAAAALPATVLQYDAAGNRIRKVDSTGETRFFANPRGEVAAEYNASNAWQGTYAYGPRLDELLSRRNATSSLFYHTDPLGSVIAVTNGSAVEQARYSYNPYGRVRSTTGTLTSSWGFTRREQDKYSGLLYLRARYYDPSLGRFITKDPTGVAGGLNLYGYAANNPLSFIDPMGTTRTAGLMACKPRWMLLAFLIPLASPM